VTDRSSDLPLSPREPARQGGPPLVLFALEPRAYSEAIGGAVAHLRPGLEVLVVDPDALPAEMGRRAPSMVFSSEPKPDGPQGAARWVQFSPYDDPDVVRVDGRAESFPGLGFEELLGLVDRLSGQERGARVPRGSSAGDPSERTVAKQILIVEDHASFSEVLELVLGPATYHRAATLADGLVLAVELGPFDLAVVDLMLPDGDGTDIVRAIKERWPETPVCVLSAVRDLSGALEAGADEAIHKGVPLPEIAATLLRLASDRDRTAR